LETDQNPQRERAHLAKATAKGLINLVDTAKMNMFEAKVEQQVAQIRAMKMELDAHVDVSQSIVFTYI